MRVSARVASLMLIVAVTLTVPAGTHADDRCDPYQTASSWVADIVQNDAGSGADAGDDGAVALALVADGDFRGALDVPGPALTDADDWYTFTVEPGADALMANITQDYNVPAPAILPFFMDVHAPDGTMVGGTSSTSGDTVRIETPAPGTWSFHVYYLDGISGDCDAPPVTIDGVPAAASDEMPGYRFYVGCDPVCVSL